MADETPDPGEPTLRITRHQAWVVLVAFNLAVSGPITDGAARDLILRLFETWPDLEAEHAHLIARPEPKPEAP